VSGNGFSHGSDLVHLEKQAVACLAINGHLDALGVCDREIVTNDLKDNRINKILNTFQMVLSFLRFT
jgi:hypothetical protein